MTAQALLLGWLKSRTQAAGWLSEKADLLAADAPDKIVFTSYSACVRFAGKAPLNLDASDLQAAHAAVKGWDPSDWTCDVAARAFLLSAMPATDRSAKLMDQIYHTADVGEAVAMQKSLAILANPQGNSQGHMARAREAIRSNIKSVFEAITLRNPYPALHFDEIGWNQMVVKTFFVESPLNAIEGLDVRANPRLAHMLDDLAHERWAAKRAFSPLLWRCVGPCADERALQDLEKVLAQGSPAEQGAAALALKSCPDPRAERILASNAALADAARAGRLTWETVANG